jgi:hypothetical protein
MLPPAAPLAYTLFVGVDIAAKTATAAWTMDGTTALPPLTVEQTPSGYARLRFRWVVLRGAGMQERSI